MKRKSSAAASRLYQRTRSLLANGIIERALTSEFEHPFKVSGVKGRRTISWPFGPFRETVWAVILRRFPELGVEAMVSALDNGGADLGDGGFTFQIPQWVRRLDFFNAPVEEFPRLLLQGGSPDEFDLYGITPLEYAISRRNPERAIALIEAGASVDSYGVGGWQREMVVGMPDVVAAIEAVHLRQVTAFAEAMPHRRRPKALRV